jgi:hypothetical protein
LRFSQETDLIAVTFYYFILSRHASTEQTHDFVRFLPLANSEGRVAIAIHGLGIRGWP